MVEQRNSKAMQRITALLDADSFVELGAAICARATDFNMDAAKEASDGVVCGYGLIDGCLVFVYAQDADVLGGSIGEMHARKICDTYERAARMGAPVIGLLDSTGVRLQEGTDALDAIGRIYAASAKASGVIPQIAAVFGSCGGGLAVLCGMSDFVYMEKDARLFVAAPNAVAGAPKDLATAEYQYRSGNIDAYGETADVLGAIRALIPVIPSCNLQKGVTDLATDDLNRASVALSADPADMDAILADLADGGLFCETRAGFAPCMRTGLMCLGGTTVGVIANDGKGEKALIGANGAAKAAAFIRFCDAFSIPLLSIADTDGYSADADAQGGLISAAAALTSAFASATVPKITLIRSRLMGTAGVLMNSRAIGADLVYALAGAKIGVMDPEMEAKILFADAGAASVADGAAKLSALAESAAAARGLVDRVMEPADARKYLIAGFEMLLTKSEDTVYRKHAAK